MMYQYAKYMSILCIKHEIDMKSRPVLPLRAYTAKFCSELEQLMLPKLQKIQQSPDFGLRINWHDGHR